MHFKGNVEDWFLAVKNKQSIMGGSEASDSEKEGGDKQQEGKGKIQRSLQSMLSQMQLTDDEIKYRMENFENADVKKEYMKYLKCTKCNMNFQKVVNKGENVGIHPLLGVLMCDSCCEYYGDGNFSLDSEGEDKYCRWCGEGGTIFACSQCICGFCDECIKKHFGEKGLENVKNDDDWICYFCDPKPLWYLRSICSLASEAARSKRDHLKKSKEGSSVRKKKRKKEELGNDLSKTSSDSSDRSGGNSKKKVKKRRSFFRSNEKRKGDNSSSSEDEKENHINSKKRPVRSRKESTETDGKKDSSESDSGNPKKKSKTSGSKSEEEDEEFEKRKREFLQKLKSIWRLTQTITEVGFTSSRAKIRRLSKTEAFGTLKSLQKEYNELKSCMNVLTSSLNTASNSVNSIREDLTFDTAKDETESFRSQEIKLKTFADEFHVEESDDVTSEEGDSSRENGKQRRSKRIGEEGKRGRGGGGGGGRGGRRGRRKRMTAGERKSYGESVKKKCDEKNNSESLFSDDSGSDEKGGKEEGGKKRELEDETSKPLLKVKSFARMLDANAYDGRKKSEEPVVIDLYDMDTDESEREGKKKISTKGELKEEEKSERNCEKGSEDQKNCLNGKEETLESKKENEETKNAEEESDNKQKKETNDTEDNSPEKEEEKKENDSSDEKKEESQESKNGREVENTKNSESEREEEEEEGNDDSQNQTSANGEESDGEKSNKSEEKQKRSDESGSENEEKKEEEEKNTNDKEDSKKSSNEEKQNKSSESESDATATEKEQNPKRKTRGQKKEIKASFEKFKRKRKRFLNSRENTEPEKMKNTETENTTKALESSESETEKSERKNKKTKKRRILASSDDENEQKEENEDENEEEEEEEKSGEEINEKAKSDSEVTKLTSEESSEEESNDKKRKRIKRRNNSDSSEEEKKKKREKSSSDTSEDEKRKKKTKGRRNIKKILKKDSLQLETKEALKNEEERKKRVKERQKLFEEIFPEEDQRQLVLDFNPETKEPLVTVHKKLAKKLKPHQAMGVRFMWDNCFESVQKLEEDSGSGCILAHCMGLGKTLQVITLVHTVMTHDLGVNSVLIVCPLSTVSNWIREFEMWLENIHTDPITLYDLVKYKRPEERLFQLRDWQENGGVLVLSYDLFRNLTKNVEEQKAGKKKKNKKKPKQKKTFKTALVDPGPDLVICDEGHLLKNVDTALSKCMNRVKTRRRIVLTGTPLQNNLVEYHCMVQFVKPNILGTRKEFCNRFVNPISNGQFEDSTELDVKIMKRRSHVLHSMLDGCIQRFDYSVLTPFLPEKHEYVLMIAVTDAQAKAYQHFINNLSAKSYGSSRATGLFNDFHVLQRIWTHPRAMLMQIERDNVKAERESSGSLKDFVVSTSEEEESEESGSESDSVQEVTPKKRILRSNANDPDVKKAMEEEEKQQKKQWWDEFYNEEAYDDLRESNKLVILFSLLKYCGERKDKVLVFSQSLYSLDLIEYFLAKVDENRKKSNETLCGHTGRWELGSDYFRLDGSTSSDTRASWCKYFNKESNTRARLFLISTRAGGLGINLYGANRVVIFDASWNPSHDLQSIFRVYRFGQKKPCYIYRFLSEGTMEEKIYERQVTKLSLAHRVVDEHQIERHYTMGNLQELYTFQMTPKENRKVPNLPKDSVLADLLTEHKDLIVRYHEHDSLLENKQEEELSEEERKAAWKEYEEEKVAKMFNFNLTAEQQIRMMQQGMMPQGMQMGQTSNFWFAGQTDKQNFINPMYLQTIPHGLLERGLMVGVTPLPNESVEAYLNRVFHRESWIQAGKTQGQ